MPINKRAAIDNPCLKEQKLTYKCLSDNNYVASECNEYFHNYQSCKSFWNFVQSDRRRNNMYPLLPPLEERAQVKEEYLRKYGAKAVN